VTIVPVLIVVAVLAVVGHEAPGIDFGTGKAAEPIPTKAA
jgi:hypothetical protein